MNFNNSLVMFRHVT